MTLGVSYHQDARLRVLLASRAGPAGKALANWLAEQTGVLIAGPCGSAPRAVALSIAFQPHIVLLDFHGFTPSTIQTVTRLKGCLPPPLVVVLTHDASDAMRRRCREAMVDAIFDKTQDLEAVIALLKRANRARYESSINGASVAIPG